jgi:hypothetical protein
MLQHGGDQGGEGLDRRRAAILDRKIAARPSWGDWCDYMSLDGNTERK